MGIKNKILGICLLLICLFSCKTKKVSCEAYSQINKIENEIS